MVAILYFVVGVLAIIGIVTCFKAFLDWLDYCGDEIDLTNLDSCDLVYPEPEKPATTTKVHAKRQPRKPSKRVKK